MKRRRRRPASRGPVCSRVPRPGRRCALSGPRAAAVRVSRAGFVMVVALAVIAVAGCDHRSAAASSGPFLPVAVATPAGVTARPFSPAGLGVTVDVPATWTPAAPASGFDYVLDGPSGSGQFLLATRAPGFTSARQLLDNRRSFLKSVGATIQSTRSGAIGSRPAVKLQYRLPGRNGRPAVNDIEYDTLVGTSGAALVVVGHVNGGAADLALVAWITSTIRANP